MCRCCHNPTSIIEGDILQKYHICKSYDLPSKSNAGYLNKKSQEVEEIKEEKEIKQEKKTYINPLKEKDKLERKIKKLEEAISKKEEEIQNLKIELTKEEVYSDYVKVGQIQETISTLNEELENDMLLWEEMQEELENIVLSL